MYLGKNTNITRAAKNCITEHCMKNQLGREDIALDLGITKGTLDNKLKPSMLNALFTIEEVMQLSEITDDNSILKAMCEERGLVVFDPIELMPDGGDVIHELVTAGLDIDSFKGMLSKEIKDAIEDNLLEEHEIKKILPPVKAIRKIARKIEVMLCNTLKLGGCEKKSA